MKLATLSILLAFAFIFVSCGTEAADPQAEPQTQTSVEQKETPAAPQAADTVSEPENDTTPETVAEAETPAAPEPDEKPADQLAQTQTRATFQARSPVAKFTAEDLKYLGIDLNGSPREIADAIRVWQEKNMVYGPNDPNVRDFSDPIRWNYFLPGIFDSEDIIHEQVTGGKVYGICLDYAVIYASIADYYGLEYRILNSKSKPSESDPSITITTGMAPEEYDRFKVKIQDEGLDYAYDAVALVAEETPTHYWAEVKIDGEWIIEDATQVTIGNDVREEFFNSGDYVLTDWLSRDKSAVLDEYQQKLDNGERLPAPQMSSGGAPGGPGGQTADYEGITDDLGQPGRAANIDDLMSGKALAPYFNKIEDAYEFIRMPQSAWGYANEDQKVKEAYESATGKKFYLVAWLVSEDFTGQEFIQSYYKYSGDQLDVGAYAAANMD